MRQKWGLFLGSISGEKGRVTHDPLPLDTPAEFTVEVPSAKALPKAIVARWNQEINRLVQLSDMKERMAADGMESTGGSPERAREVFIREVAKWQKVVKIANIKPDG